MSSKLATTAFTSAAIAGASPSVQVRSFATAGAGTEASPYTSTDGTAGSSAALATLTRGGKIVYGAARFDISSTININGPSVTLEGIAAGFNIDPNGEQEGSNGTKLHVTAQQAITIPYANMRFGAVKLRNLYLYGTGETHTYNAPTRTSGIYMVGALDTALFSELNISGFDSAIQLGDGIHTGNYAYATSDSMVFEKLALLNNFAGIDWRFALGFFDKIRDCNIADNDGFGVLINPTYGPLLGTSLTGCDIVRNGRISNVGLAAGVYWNVNDGWVSGNIFYDQGHDAQPNTYSSTGADGIGVQGNFNTITGNVFSLNTVGSGIHVYSGATGNILANNIFDTVNPNLHDITIDSGALDTVITGYAGNRLVDNGTRTRLNGTGTNAGDPDTTGNWSGITKPAGLIIHDTTNNIYYLYFPGGTRKVL